MQRPLTEPEKTRERTLKAWTIGLCIGLTFPKEIRGFTRWMHDNTAGSECYGMRPHFHVHYHTNHQPNHERTAA